MADETCRKWNKIVTEASCNICKDQCDLSIADPDHYIAKKLIVDLEQVLSNRLEMNRSIDMDFMRKDIEENFKDKAVIIIDRLGLTHMMVEIEDEELP